MWETLNGHGSLAVVSLAPLPECSDETCGFDLCLIYQNGLLDGVSTGMVDFCMAEANAFNEEGFPVHASLEAAQNIFHEPPPLHFVWKLVV